MGIVRGGWNLRLGPAAPGRAPLRLQPAPGSTGAEPPGPAGCEAGQPQGSPQSSAGVVTARFWAAWSSRTDKVLSGAQDPFPSLLTVLEQAHSSQSVEEP